jgi:hypothetical protein
MSPVLRPLPPRYDEPHNGKPVPLADLGYGQCRAIVGHEQNTLHGLAVYCGQPTVVGLGGQMTSWCQRHYAEYTLDPRTRKRDAFVRRPPDKRVNNKFVFKKPKAFDKTKFRPGTTQPKQLTAASSV